MSDKKGDGGKIFSITQSTRCSDCKRCPRLLEITVSESAQLVLTLRCDCGRRDVEFAVYQAAAEARRYGDLQRLAEAGESDKSIDPDNLPESVSLLDIPDSVFGKYVM